MRRLNFNGYQNEISKGYQFHELKSFLKDKQFATINKGLFSSCILTPVQIELFDNGKSVCRVTAVLSEIKIKSKTARFSGNVIVEASDKVLITDELILSIQKANFSVKGPYTLRSKEGAVTGVELTTDIFLNAIEK